jgi:hypothetical protein
MLLHANPDDLPCLVGLFGDTLGLFGWRILVGRYLVVSAAAAAMSHHWSCPDAPPPRDTPPAPAAAAFLDPPILGKHPTVPAASPGHTRHALQPAPPPDAHEGRVKRGLAGFTPWRSLVLFTRGMCGLFFGAPMPRAACSPHRPRRTRHGARATTTSGHAATRRVAPPTGATGRGRPRPRPGGHGGRGGPGRPRIT